VPPWARAATLGIANGAAVLASILSCALVIRPSAEKSVRPLSLSLALVALAFGGLTADSVTAYRSIIIGLSCAASIASAFFAIRFVLMISSFANVDDAIATIQAVRPGDAVLPENLGRIAKRTGLTRLNEWLSKPRKSPRQFEKLDKRLQASSPDTIRSFIATRTAVIAGALAVVSGFANLRMLPWVIAYFYAMMAGMLCFQLLITSFSRGSEQQRRRVLWLVEGAVGAFVLIQVPIWMSMVAMLVTLTSDAPPPTMMLVPIGFAAGAFVMIGSVGIAAFAEGAVDPALAIRKTTAYGALGILFTTCFVAIEQLVSSLTVWSLHLSNQSAAIVAGTVAAIALGPLRSRIEKRTNRFIDRRLPVSGSNEAADTVRAFAFCDLIENPNDAAGDESAVRAVALFHKEARTAAINNEARIARTIGDGVLIECPTPASALETAAALMRTFPDACTILGLPAPAISAGIHADLDPAPEGVASEPGATVAARLQGTALPGQIIATSAAADALNASGACTVRPLGQRTLRNIQEPVACFEILKAELRPVDG
jgi:class 3 adenylate cyclase